MRTITKILKPVLVISLLVPFFALRTFAWTLQNDQQNKASTNPVSATAFTVPLTNPSIIVVGIWRVFSGTAITAPTDTAGNTYTDCGAGAIAGGSPTNRLQMFCTINTHTTASNVISESNAAGDLIQITGKEFTGGPISGSIASIVRGFATNAGANTGVGGGQNLTTTAIAGTVAGDLIVAHTVAQAGILTAGPGWTIDLSDQFGEWQVGAGGSIAATWNDNVNNDTYAAMAIDIKPIAVNITELASSQVTGQNSGAPASTITTSAGNTTGASLIVLIIDLSGGLCPSTVTARLRAITGIPSLVRTAALSPSRSGMHSTVLGERCTQVPAILLPGRKELRRRFRSSDAHGREP